MKPTRYISLIIALLSVLGIAAQQQQQSQYALYNYRNDGDFNAWLNIDIDSITYSNISIDSVEYDNLVTQEVWTPDSCYRIPLEAIDSIGFRAPEPIMREGIFYLRDYHAAFTNSIDSLTIYFNNSILNDSLPSVGQPILCATKMTPYEDGFAGKVKAIRNENDKVVVECEMLCVADVYKRLVMAGRAITETEAKENARKRAAGDPWVKYEDSDVIIKDLGDIKLNILDGLFFANSIKPTLQVNYFVYVDEDIYDMSATIRLNHNDLEYGVDLNLNKLLAIDDTISADKESKEITQALLRMRNYKNMSQEDWVNSIVEEVKKKGEKEKLDADQAGLMKGMWKEMHKEWEIPIGGPFTLGLEIGPLLDLKGSVDIQGKIKTKARNTIYIEAKGSTTATLASPTIALATGLAKINGYSDFHIEPIQSLSVGINAKGSLDVGFFGKASLNLIHKSVVHASGSIKAGLKLAGNIGYTWDSETWYDEDFSTLFDLDPLYDGMKDTKIKLEAFADLGLEVGITPWKFLTAGAEFELGKADLGSCYLFPHFSQPAFPTYDYKNDQWSNGNYDNHMVLESSPSKNIPDFLLGPCKIGMKIIDKNGVCVKESDEREYRDDGTIYWGLFPLSIDLTGLTPGNTYRCFPVLRYHDWQQLRATPSYEFTIPDAMTLDKDAITLQKGKTAYVAINDGWGDFSAHTSMRMICDAEIATIGNRHFVKIVAKTQMAGSATVTVKDLRSGETAAIRVTVTSNDVPEELVLSEEFVTLQESESKIVYIITGSGSYTAESSNKKVATASIDKDKIFIAAVGEGSALITVTDTETEKTVDIDVTVTPGTTPEPDGHEWVDLGLPSRTLWATCNVGANSPEEYGDYFAWGETEPKSTYAWSTYKYCNGSYNTLTKYCTQSDFGTVDNKTELEPADDAATINWGSDWQMPSKEQMDELINGSYTTATWTTQNGVNGLLITSKSNGRSVFMPASGYLYSGSAFLGSRGYYWTRSLIEENSYEAYDIRFYSKIDRSDDLSRYFGQSVRPVRVQKKNEEHEWVNLGLPSGTLWATCNVGANSPEEYGDYFAWGETEPKNEYNRTTYFDTEDDGSLLKKYHYNGGLKELLPEDDAAIANWGIGWQMPSYAQIEELTNSSYTTTEWTTRNGVNGRLVTSKSNGNSIFLPAVGIRRDTSLDGAGSYGWYWSRSLLAENDLNCGSLHFVSNGVRTTICGRFYGLCVRPVRKQSSGGGGGGSW